VQEENPIKFYFKTKKFFLFAIKSKLFFETWDFCVVCVCLIDSFSLLYVPYANRLVPYFALSLSLSLSNLLSINLRGTKQKIGGGKISSLKTSRLPYQISLLRFAYRIFSIDSLNLRTQTTVLEIVQFFVINFAKLEAFCAFFVLCPVLNWIAPLFERVQFAYLSKQPDPPSARMPDSLDFFGFNVWQLLVFFVL